MSASKNLHYFSDKTFSIPNGVQTPLEMAHKFLWVTAICHALVILNLHSKSPSQITSASQLLLPTSDLHILQNTSPTTCGDWDKHRSDDSPMATQQISDQESKRSPRLLTLHTLLSAVLNLSRKEPYRQDLNHLEITCKLSILKQK